MNSARGSLWRKWDLHVHTPESELANGFGDDFKEYAKNLFKAAIDHKIAVVGVTDYFGIWGYKRLKEIQETTLHELLDDDKLAEKARKVLLLPNIEFRLDVLVNDHRVNFHVLFSDEVDCADIEENFLHDIKVLYEGGPQGPDDARKLSKRTLSQIGADLKQEHAFNGTDLHVGMMNSFVSHSQISDILARQPGLFEGKYLLAVVADEDLSKVSWNGQGHLTRKVLIQKSDFLFASNPKTIDWGLGLLGYSKPEDFSKEFKSLKPCLHGSDAHAYERLFRPEHDRFCWIKSDISFGGLKQALHEPSRRVFIGEQPEARRRIAKNRSKFIDKLTINWTDAYQGHKGQWFQNIDISLNPELVAVIGNKGGGKSALADIIALSGNSYQERQKYSFLREMKFGSSLSRNFQATIEWFSKDVAQIPSLDQDFSPDKTEGVKYLPQSHFEDICNEIDSSDKFRREIEKVVFQHVPDFERAGYDSFDELVRAKESTAKAEIDTLKNELSTIIDDLVVLDEKSHSSYRNKIKSAIDEKQTALKSHLESPPEVVPKPKDAEESNPVSRNLKKRRTQLEDIEAKIDSHEEELTRLNRLTIEIDEQIETFENLKRQIDKAKEQSKSLLAEWEIDIEEVLKIEFNASKLKEYKKQKTERIQSLKAEFKVRDIELSENAKILYDGEEWEEADLLLVAPLIVQRDFYRLTISSLEKRLSETQRKFEEYQEKRKIWEKRRDEIQGKADGSEPDTLKYFEKVLRYLDNELTGEIASKRQQLIEKALGILGEKNRIKSVYDSIKESIETELASEHDLLAKYPINIESSLRVKPDLSERILAHVNKNRSGTFYRMEDDGEPFQVLLKDRNIGEEGDLKDFLSDVLNRIDSDHRPEFRGEQRSIVDQVSDLGGFYRSLFSLDYLEVKYDLKHGEKSLEALSPGERGALLLVFYLMLDKSETPLIIDQPEDNLDNQSVAEILVPFIQKAKQRRQIIMVTHNPNLAVVADAEQIIRVDLKKDEDNRFEFKSGAIENPEINREIVDVLEGRMPAFSNRSIKYLRDL